MAGNNDYESGLRGTTYCFCGHLRSQHTTVAGQPGNCTECPDHHAFGSDPPFIPSNGAFESAI